MAVLEELRVRAEGWQILEPDPAEPTDTIQALAPALSVNAAQAPAAGSTTASPMASPSGRCEHHSTIQLPRALPQSRRRSDPHPSDKAVT
jgi:hypothetical protein